MFDFFGSMFGSQSSRSTTEITQLYKLHATFRFATREALDGEIKSDDALGTRIDKRAMELYYQMDKTHIIDEYDYWGPYGERSTSTVEKVNESTSNTMGAIFALINGDKEKFDRLVKEGPTPKELTSHEETKQRLQDNRKKYLEKVAACEHFFGGGFYQRDNCSKCKIRKEDINDKPTDKS